MKQCFRHDFDGRCDQGRRHSGGQDRPFPLALRQHGNAPTRRPFGGGPRSWLLCRRQRSRLVVLKRACKVRRSATAVRNRHHALCGIHPARLESGYAPVSQFHELRSPMAGGVGFGRQSRPDTLGVGRMRAQGHRSVSPHVGCSALQDRASGGRGVFVSARLGVHAPGSGCLLRAGSRTTLFADGMRKLLADRLMALFAANQREDWLWFEDVLAYDNARLPQALIQTGLATQTHGIRRGRAPIAALAHVAPDRAVRMLQTRRHQELRQDSPEARRVRSAAGRGGGNDFRVPCRVARE